MLKQEQESGCTSQTVLSSQTVYPLRQEFIVGTQKKRVDELIDIQEVSIFYTYLLNVFTLLYVFIL